MIKEYSQNRSNVIMNFSIKYCDTPKELLSSKGFKKVLSKYISILEKKDALLIDRLYEVIDEDNLSTTLLRLFKLLVILDSKEIINLNNVKSRLLRLDKDLIEFVEGFYNYWRSLERYALIQSSANSNGIENVNFIDANNNFSNLILKVYRTIEENILGYNHNIYRQLSAGINAGIVLSEGSSNIPQDYNKLNNIQFIKSVVLTPPFVIYPKRNKRSGFFKEVYENPINDLNINISHYFCYPAKVGESLAFVYFHRDFMSHGISLSNLFELAKPEEYEYKSPNLVYVFGSKLPNKEKKTIFYSDKKNDMYVGFVSTSDEIDYFGYMKKMILTLHNVYMIKHNRLPIHGAMVNIVLDNDVEKNIVIIGDSGAGKSETLEALRFVADAKIKEMNIVFDDMGVFYMRDNTVYAKGTEIGAFIRLDDLETGYAYKELDRAIFLNPERHNARVILPVSSHEFIVKEHKIDYVFSANNYEDAKDSIRYFDNIEAAVPIFVEGKRKAKGTTAEVGLVSSYFSNPFGCVQFETETKQIIDDVFATLFESKVVIGELYTKLAITGKEASGVKKAAKAIKELL